MTDACAFRGFLQTLAAHNVARQVLRRHVATASGHAIAVEWILLSVNSFLQRDEALAAWSLACLFAGVNRDAWSRTL